MKKSMLEVELGPALTWDELADAYPGTARIKPIQDMFNYFAKQTDLYYVCPEKETIHRILDTKEEIDE